MIQPMPENSSLHEGNTGVPWEMKRLAHAIRTHKGAGLLVVIGFLTWRIFVTGLSNDYAAQGTPVGDARALHWQSDQPFALARQSQAFNKQTLPEAEITLQYAIRANPTDALPYLALAEQWQHLGHQHSAETLANIADTLGPLRIPVLARSAAFWLRQNRPDLVLARWGILLTIRPENKDLIYPVLLQLAEDPNTRDALLSLLQNPPEWWDQFFSYAAHSAMRLETVTFLYKRRNRNHVLPQVEEQKAYLERLWKEKEWLAAYLTWLSGLDATQRQRIGNLYNGGFDLPMTNFGFDWQISTPISVIIETLNVYTNEGKAVHLHFKGERVHFKDLYQYLYLEPGHYRFQGQSRLDSLQTEHGLRWRVHCVSDEKMLTQSELFVGSNDWQDIKFEFQVPKQNCPLQRLRLELEDRSAVEFEVRGDVWFDNLAINRLHEDAQ